MEEKLKGIKVIGFDADDTLWINETFFRKTEAAFAKLMSPYETNNQIDQELFKVEMQNLARYGYGVKSFMLSMVETAIMLSDGRVPNQTIMRILKLGKAMIDQPVELLKGVEETLSVLHKKYKLVLITKGDLLDQERKLEKSGLSNYFDHIEILSEKKAENYRSLLKHLDTSPSKFLMIGNSLKSDVLPLVKLKSNAIHVPFHTTWIHEQVSVRETTNKSFWTIDSLEKVLNLIS